MAEALSTGPGGPGAISESKDEHHCQGEGNEGFYQGLEASKKVLNHGFKTITGLAIAKRAVILGATALAIVNVINVTLYPTPSMGETLT